MAIENAVSNDFYQRLSIVFTFSSAPIRGVILRVNVIFFTITFSWLEESICQKWNNLIQVLLSISISSRKTRFMEGMQIVKLNMQNS